ncbi:hypothetical protein KSP39_PZI020278 [Platanthera zijinensis]|uniref:RING-CH-type domain-containing protein n=1 Tax=Platanthera zijinensis TaxID=2320716 RepID=A0AAP0B047_9ASPA
MGDHVVLCVDRLTATQAAVTVQAGEHPPSSSAPVEKVVTEEEEPLIQLVECRICQDEDHVKNLETPCACRGSLKYAHRECVQRWCNEKGDIICEICHETYKSGYTAPPLPPDETTIDISGGWTITGAPIDLRDPRIISIAASQRHFLEAEYDEYSGTNASGAAFCRSAALILMALLLLRHALSVTTDGDDEDDASTYFSLFLLRAAGFLLPCYIMAWAISILNQRRQRREEAAALAAAEVAFILQSGRGRSLQFTIAPDTPATPQQEPHQ